MNGTFYEAGSNGIGIHFGKSDILTRVNRPSSDENTASTPGAKVICEPGSKLEPQRRTKIFGRDMARLSRENVKNGRIWTGETALTSESDL
jgi:hypothetical protein